MPIDKNSRTKNFQSKSVPKTIKVIEISTRVGPKLNKDIRIAEVNEPPPLLTILMILPVSRLRWKAKL